MNGTNSNATTKLTAHTHTYKHGKHSKTDKLRLSLYFVHNSHIFEEARGERGSGKKGIERKLDKEEKRRGKKREKNTERERERERKSAREKEREQ